MQSNSTLMLLKCITHWFHFFLFFHIWYLIHYHCFKILCFGHHWLLKTNNNIAVAVLTSLTSGSAQAAPNRLVGFRWITSLWNTCTKSCGRGVSQRMIYCVEEHMDGGFQRTEDEFCTDPQPETERPCNDFDCPRWYAGQWSPVGNIIDKL